MSRPLTRILLAALFGLAMERAALATVTIEVFFENGALPDDTVALLVVDKSNNGFTPLSDPGVIGTRFEAGGTIGSGDDTILAVFLASNGDEWAANAGIAEVIAGIDYEQLGLSEGMPLAIYAFPGLSGASRRIIHGDDFIVYRDTGTGGSGGTIPFALPADPGFYTLAAITAVNGGTFDPGNPGATETLLAGNAALETTGPDDHGNGRGSATAMTGNQTLGGLITLGDVDFFRIELVRPSVFSARTAGVATVLEVLNEEGNPVLAGQVLAPGVYFVAVRGGSGGLEGPYTLAVSSRAALSARPDGRIGATRGRQIGANRVNRTGRGQTVNLISIRGRAMQAFFTIQNRGDYQGTLSVRASVGNRDYQLRYLRLTGGTANVTAAVRRGSGHNGAYARNGAILYRLEIKPTRKGIAKRKRGNFAIDARGGGIVDRVGAKTTIR